MALLICDRTDKDRLDTTFVTFCENMLVLTLQEIIAQVPYARWLENEATLNLVAGTQYVAIPSDMDIDNIISFRDETNNFTSTRIAPEDADLIDPGRFLTGREFLWWHQVVGGADRLYFLNRPDTTHNLKEIGRAHV